MMLWFLRSVMVVQMALAVRVFGRMARSANGSRIERRPPPTGGGQVTILVPVLDEATRIGPCLDGLMKQGPVVSQIIVVDGGSRDETVTIVRRAGERDQRIRLVDATPVPAGANGKAHGLAVAAGSVEPDAAWLLVIDADVRVAPDLVPSLLAKAEVERLGVLSVATRQRLSGPTEGMLHPAMLTTLVYRFGIPGHAMSQVEQVQANGQCLLVLRDLLEEIGGFESVLHANAEDVTLVRALVAAGHRAGFYEAGPLVEVEMYPSWHAAWQGWSRSLPMRDRFSTWRLPLSLLEAVLVQATPLVLWPICCWRWGLRSPMAMAQASLLAGRLGVLAGTRRAYVNPPFTYWLSPLLDLPVALQLMRMAGRRQFTWRGRTLVTGDHA